MKASELLHAAGDLLEKPGAWTQGNFACDAHGKAVSSYDTDAVCWCASGALRKVSSHLYALAIPGESMPVPFLDARACLRQITGIHNIATWNDVIACTQEEVVNTFRKAEQLAKDQGL